MWTDKKSYPMAPHTQTLPPGACFEFGNATSPLRATSIRVSPAGNSRTAFFARYPKATFADVAKIDPSPPDGGTWPPPAPHPANAEKTPVTCKDVPSPANGSIKDKDTIWVRQCPLPIPNWGHYRICFDAQFVELPGGALSGWPPERLPIVLDKSLIDVVSKSNSEDPRTNWISGNQCRDYYDVQSAYVLVGRTLGDINFDPGGQWDPSKVQKVHMWIAHIK